MSIRVTFKGRDLWYLGESLTDLNHSLAPLYHCDDDGHIRLLFANSDSFAHVYEDGRILQRGRQIGTVRDLLVVENP